MGTAAPAINEVQEAIKRHHQDVLLWAVWLQLCDGWLRLDTPSSLEGEFVERPAIRPPDGMHLAISSAKDNLQQSISIYIPSYSTLVQQTTTATTTNISSSSLITGSSNTSSLIIMTP
jgi:hypothetical protein